jgi:HEAT repeat protein
VIDIVLDEISGNSKQMFLATLDKLKSPEAIEELKQLVNDTSGIIRKEALLALKNNK